MKQRRIIFVINPIAGTKSKLGLESTIKDVVEPAGIEYSIVHSARSTNWHTLQHYAESFGATDMVACGGDGTVNLVAGAVKGTNVNLGILPLGSGNGLARTANIPMKPVAALAVIVAGKVQETDTFCVNKHFGCMLAGVGLDAAVASSFAQQQRRGLITYTSQSLLEFFKSHPYQFELCIDGFSFFTDAYLISVANSNQYGNNVTIAPLASISDGMLDVVVVQKMPKVGLPLALLQQIRGNNRLRALEELVGKKHVLYFQSTALEIKNRQLAPLHVDGDPVSTAEDILFQIKPHTLRLIIP